MKPTDDPSESDSRAKGSGRWMKIALCLSLAMNVAVIGVAAGVFLREPPGAAALRPSPFGPYGAALDDEDRRALREAFRARAAEIREVRSATRADMQALAAALRTSPVDRAAIRAALDQGAARSGRLIELGQQVLFERLVSLPDDRRLALADRLDSATRRVRRDRPSEPGQ